MKIFTEALKRFAWRREDTPPNVNAATRQMLQASLTANQRKGAVMRSSLSRHADKVFFCAFGRRHWIQNARWLDENGFRWPDDVEEVAPQVIDAFLPGQSAPCRHGDDEWFAPKAVSAWEMRELCTSKLHGSGIEVGAGANPMPIPLDCRIRYVDIFNESELQENRYDGQSVSDIVRPDVVATFDNLDQFPAKSIDFAVACHVIEHTRDPIGAIVGAWKKLRSGGSVVLVVPEITRTFDRNRELTALEHLIQDFREPDVDRVRDKPHFQEFYSKAFVIEAQDYERMWQSRWSEAYPIHYHTWTHDSFMKMITWMIAQGLLPELEEAWSHPPLANDEHCIEFWVTLRKLP